MPRLVYPISAKQFNSNSLETLITVAMPQIATRIEYKPINGFTFAKYLNENSSSHEIVAIGVILLDCLIFALISAKVMPKE